jgi:hypothetical protein
MQNGTHVAAVLELCHGEAAWQPEVADVIKVGAPVCRQGGGGWQGDVQELQQGYDRTSHGVS